jgi:hypothetical protein
MATTHHKQVQLCMFPEIELYLHVRAHQPDGPVMFGAALIEADVWSADRYVCVYGMGVYVYVYVCVCAL